MKILAYLQNPWFKPGTSSLLIKKYKTDPEFHRRVLYLSATGRALHRAFGPELYMKIIWENANPRHGEERTAHFPADIAHMSGVLATHGPDIIICFGGEAKSGMEKMVGGREPDRCGSAKVFYAAHPMARGSVREHLRKIVEEIKEQTNGNL